MLGYRMSGRSMILVLAVLVGLTSPQVVHNTSVTPSCHGLKSKHEFSNFSVGQIFPSDDHLHICVNNGTTCCTQHMEKRLHALSQDNVRNIYTAKMDLIKKIFTEGVIRFQGFFQARIDSSESLLDQEFTRLYKKAYANNSYITKSFYTKLRKHYKSGEDETYKIVDEFFKEVLKKIFVLLNGGQSPNIDLDCVASTYDTLRPFGTVPRQLTPQLERSIAAARAMVHGLFTGKSVVEKLSDDKWFSEKCLKSVTEISQCSVCAGYSSLKPCARHCINVYSECLAPLTELEQVWDEYLSSVISVGDRLDGEYDFEAVIGELPYEISDGIMNCQKALLQKRMSEIKKKCQTTQGKTRRSVVPSDNDFFLENTVRVGRSADEKGKPRYTLGRLITQYQRHFRRLRKFWTNLPTAMCDETVVADNATAYCWDGSKIVNNTESVQQGKINQTAGNGQNDVTIASLVSQLEAAIKNLKAAARGKTRASNFSDDDDWEWSGSGESGSGSGDTSGKDSKDSKGDDDDDDEASTTAVNEIPDGDIEVLKSEDNNNNIDTKIPVVAPDVKETKRGRGGSSYISTSTLLLITSILLPFM